MHDARYDARHPVRHLHNVMKPAKPSAAFPLFAHNNGQWAKKIRGKIHYFGSWDDSDAALADYERRKGCLNGSEEPKLENIKPAVERKVSSNRKPRKPPGDFRFYSHNNGQWAKKIRSKVHYFGPWGNPDGAFERRLDQKDDLNAGRTPRHQYDGLTIRDLANRFLTVKKHLVDTGELSPRTFGDYYATCEQIIKAFGKTRLVIDLASDDFEKLRIDFSKTRGPVALGNEVQRVRVVFKYETMLESLTILYASAPPSNAQARRCCAKSDNRRDLECSRRPKSEPYWRRPAHNCEQWSFWALIADLETTT